MSTFQDQVLKERIRVLSKLLKDSRTQRARANKVKRYGAHKSTVDNFLSTSKDLETKARTVAVNVLVFCEAYSIPLPIPETSANVNKFLHKVLNNG